MASKTEVKGSDEVIAAIKGLNLTENEQIQILVNAARPIRAAMKRKAPTDTTLLQQSVVIQDLKSKVEYE